MLSVPKIKKMQASVNIAVIGIDAQFGAEGCGTQSNIDRVERALYLGKSSLNEVNVAISADLTNLCQSSVERLAKANQLNSDDIKLVIVSEQAIEIQNAQVLSNLAQALALSQTLLEQGEVVALLGVNVSAVMSLPQEQTATISFDQTFKNYQQANGIASILLSTAKFAIDNQNYVYAWLKSFASNSDLNITIENALSSANISSTDIGLLEVSALSDSTLSKTESDALITSYGNDSLLNTAISCARSVTGEGAGFSQVLGFLRTVISLQQRYIPAISDWQNPHSDELGKWQQSNFYLPTESRPWYPHSDGSAHFAAYSCLSGVSEKHDYCHVILQENKLFEQGVKHPANDIRKNGFIACSDISLVLVSGDNEQELLSNIATLPMGMPLKALANECFSKKRQTYTVALICESQAELEKEISSAKEGIANAFATQRDWRTPKGSFFTPVPVNAAVNASEIEAQNISFLYPGIGATYVGLGRDLFHLFPEIHQDVADLADDIGASLKDTLLNPRFITRPDFKALKQLDLNLRGNLADIAEAGVGFACVFTKVFENVFKVKADYATGYSMGEVSMYAALGAWQQPGLMSARLANSDTFNQRLCGDLLTLREHWGLANDANEGADPIWETYTIKATLAQVIDASEGEDRVYCTIINTPDSLLLAGYPEACLRVIKKLGVRAMALNMANAIHSAPAKKEYNDMVELYTMDVTERIKTKMYSSSCYLPVPQMSKAIANSVAKCLCDIVDFPRLINTMHDKGARVFIEMGPGRSLCSWVDKILDHQAGIENQEKSRVSVPVNAKGTSDELTYLRAIAKLTSHGVKLDLETLFNGSIVVRL